MTTRPDMVFVRASLHDTTAAIPRAMEAGNGVFEDRRILCWNRTGANLPKRQDGEVRISRFQRSPRPRSLAAVLATLGFMTWVFGKLLRSRPRCIQVCDLESAIPAAVVTLLSGARLIYDMRDPFAESYGFGKLAKRLAYGLDWLAMSTAHAFVVPAEERIPYLGRWGRKRPVCVVRNTCHDELAAVLEVPAPAARSEPTAVHLAYMGYLVTTRGADWLVEQCSRPDHSTHLWVAGTCRSDALRRALETSTGASFLGLLPRLEALRLMHDADALTLLYDPAIPVNRIAAPNKFYEALMLGTPVLMSRGMSLAPVVESRRLGFVIEYGSSEELRRATDDLRNPALRRELSENCRSYFLEHCRLAGDLTRYRDFYRSLERSS